MKRRPVPVTVIGCVYIAAGLLGLAFHASEWRVPHPFQQAVVWVSLVRLIAIICGVYILRGADWARWLAMIWIAFHVALRAFHGWAGFLMHGLLLALFAYFLFRREATEYFVADSGSTPATKSG